MRRVLLILLLSAVASAQSTLTTLTGTIRDLSGAVVKSGRITFTLNAPDTTIPGVGRFTPSTVYCKINATGNPVSNVDGTSACTVTSNTALTPSGTSYAVCVQAYLVQPGGCFNFFALAGQTIDISTIAPTLTTLPANYSGIPGRPGNPGPAGPSGNGFYQATPNVTTPTTPNGIARTFAMCPSGMPCAVQADTQYPAGDGTTPTGTGQLLVDNSNGGQVNYFSNPFASPNGIGYQSNYNACRQQFFPLTRNASSTYESECGVFSLDSSIPGPNYGYGSPAPGAAQGWAVSFVTSVTGHFNGSGIRGGLKNNVTCAGAGDCINETNMTVYGNNTAPADEDAKSDRRIVGEATTTYRGTVASSTVLPNGFVQVYLNPTNDALNMGVGRYLHPTTPTYSGYASAINSGSLDSSRMTTMVDPNANFAVSPFHGVSVYPITVDNTLGFPAGSNGECVVVGLAAGYGTLPAPGVPVASDSSYAETGTYYGPNCDAWSNTKQYLYGEGTFYGGQQWVMINHVNNVGLVPGVDANWGLASVPAGGILAAFTFRESHEANSMLYGGGMTGYGISFRANASYTGPETLLYPSEVVGSIDNHTLALVQYRQGGSAQGWDYGNVVLDHPDIASIVVTSGTAVMTFYLSGLTQLEQAPIITVTGATPSALNGQYSFPTNNVGPTGLGEVFTATLCAAGTGINGVACTPSSYTGTSTVGGHATLGDTPYGNTRYDLYPMGRVIDVNDYRVAGNTTAKGTAALIEPNPGTALGTWAAGTTVSEPHLYSLGFYPHGESFYLANPLARNDGTYAINEIGSGSSHVTGLNTPPATFFMTGDGGANLVGAGGTNRARAYFVSLGTKGSLVMTKYRLWADAPWFDQSLPEGMPDLTKYPFAHNAVWNVRTMAANGVDQTIVHFGDVSYKTGMIALNAGGVGLTFQGSLIGQNTAHLDLGVAAKANFQSYRDPSGTYYIGTGAQVAQATTVVNDGSPANYDSAGWYFDAPPNDPFRSTNSSIMASNLGFSQYQGRSYGWSASATGAGTAGSFLAFRTRMTECGAGIVSFDTTTACDGLGTVYAKSFVGTDASKNSAVSFQQAAGGTDVLPTLSTGKSFLYYKSGALWGANGTATAPIPIVPGAFTGSCASTTTLTVVNGIITGCS